MLWSKFLFNNLVNVPPCLPGPPPPGIRIPDEEDEQDGLLDSSQILDETAALPADLGQGGFDVIPENQFRHQHHQHLKTTEGEV